MNSALVNLHMQACFLRVEKFFSDKSYDFCWAYCVGCLDTLKAFYNFSQSVYDRYLFDIYSKLNSKS